MKKLAPNHKKILDYLADGKWHCMANAHFYMKDDRKRISELNAMGYAIEGTKCDKRCGVAHSSNIFMRRLLEAPTKPQVVFKEVNGETIAILLTNNYQRL